MEVVTFPRPPEGTAGPGPTAVRVQPGPPQGPPSFPPPEDVLIHFRTLFLLQFPELSTRRRRLVHQLELPTCRTGEARALVRAPSRSGGPLYYQCDPGAVAMVTCV